MPRHQTKKKSLFFYNHGVMDCIFVMARCDKNACYNKKIKFFLFQFCKQVFFDTIHHDVHVYLNVTNENMILKHIQ